MTDQDLPVPAGEQAVEDNAELTQEDQAVDSQTVTPEDLQTDGAPSTAELEAGLTEPDLKNLPPDGNDSEAQKNRDATT